MKQRRKKEPTRDIRQVTVKELIDTYIYRIDLDAEYQRERIWARKQQEELIDSIVQNIDIPKIYLVRTREDSQFDYECIDGKQRMSTLLSFFKPESHEDNPLFVRIAGERYTYRRLQDELPQLAEKIESYPLTLVIYQANLDEEFVREIFRRLQLGVRLNSGELLKTYTGTLRDFIYKTIGNDGPFFKRTRLSEKRFSRPFTLAQICINSFRRHETGDFGRARFEDLKDFMQAMADIKKDDINLIRIKKVLELMDKAFKDHGSLLSSRAMVVSAYLFSEELFVSKRGKLITRFAKFYAKLIDAIRKDMERISNHEKPRNRRLMEEFQKYVLQASVEPYSIRRRNVYLREAFAYYLKKGGIIGS